MRVMLVVSSYLPNVGGLESVTSHLASELQRRGHSVMVLTQRYPRMLPAAEEIDGVRVQRMFFLFPRWRDLMRGRFDLFLAGLVYFPATLLQLWLQIRRKKPHVVNLHFVGATAPFVLFARLLLRFRLIVSMHGDDVEGLPRGTWFDRWVFRLILRQADGITACSRYLLERASKVEPRVRSKASVIYNGFDLPRNPSANVKDHRTILSVGRLMPSKGFDCLIRAAASVNASKNLSFILIGDGPERSRLEALGRELGLAEKVQLFGAQDHKTVIDALVSCHLVVVPSRKDSFGLVALEAMAVGKPIVATSVGGLPEVLEDADAVLVEPDDSDALADGIERVLQQLERQPGWGIRNREIAARFSMAHMVDQYNALYAGHLSEN